MFNCFFDYQELHPGLPHRQGLTAQPHRICIGRMPGSGTVGCRLGVGEGPHCLFEHLFSGRVPSEQRSPDGANIYKERTISIDGGGLPHVHVGETRARGEQLGLTLEQVPLASTQDNFGPGQPKASGFGESQVWSQSNPRSVGN